MTGSVPLALVRAPVVFAGPAFVAAAAGSAPAGAAASASAAHTPADTSPPEMTFLASHPVLPPLLPSRGCATA